MKTNFQNGTVVTPEFLNSIQGLKFNKNDGEELIDGQYYKLENDSLSDDAGQIKSDFYGFRDQLKVSGGNGLQVVVNGGRFVDAQGRGIGIPESIIPVPANKNTIIFIDKDNGVKAAESAPFISLPLAIVTTNATIVTDIYSTRTANKLFVRPDITKVLGGTGEQGDFTATQNYIFNQGYYYFNNFTIPSGINTTVKKFTKIFVAGNCIIDGLINVTPAIPGGVGVGSGTIDGLNYGAFKGGNIGATLGLADNTYHWTSSPLGSGGSSGVITAIDASSGGATNIASGGAGGGGIYIEAIGTITIKGSIVANGLVGGESFNVGDNSAASGGGGGSGGSIVLISPKKITIDELANLQVNGGVGGNGKVGNNVISGIATGGGGGGAGHIELLTPLNDIANNATIELKGGLQGFTSEGDYNRSGNFIGGGNGGSFCSNGGSGSSTTVSDNDGIDGTLSIRNFTPVG